MKKVMNPFVERFRNVIAFALSSRRRSPETTGAPDHVGHVDISGQRRSLRHPALAGLVLALAMTPQAQSRAAADDIAISMDEREIRFAGITTTRPDKEQPEIELSFPGTVAIPPQQMRVVAAPANGLVESMLVAADEPVNAGDAVAQLRSMEIVEAQRQFLAALSDEALAADRLRRMQQLFEGRAAPERELRTAETSAANAKAHLDERRQILALMELSETDIASLQNTRKIVPAVTVHAPVGGMVVKRHVSPGERVDAAAPLYTIASLNPLWINIQVPASRLSALKTGASVVLPAHGARGRLIRIARTVDPQTQSAIAVAEIDSNGGSVRPGLVTTATIRLDLGPGTQWSVPAAAVIRHRDRSWVFIRNKDGFVARPVQVLSESSARTSIRADLGPDDLVADRGLIALLSELAAADKG
jgi:membrane fusion protein, heavy metal efflux system